MKTRKTSCFLQEAESHATDKGVENKLIQVNLLLDRLLLRELFHVVVEKSFSDTKEGDAHTNRSTGLKAKKIKQRHGNSKDTKQKRRQMKRRKKHEKRRMAPKEIIVAFTSLGTARIEERSANFCVFQRGESAAGRLWGRIRKANMKLQFRGLAMGYCGLMVSALHLLSHKNNITCFT